MIIACSCDQITKNIRNKEITMGNQQALYFSTLLTGLFVSTVNAATINFNEASDGDIDLISGTPFTSDIGYNVIAGSISTGSSSDFDSFTFFIPENTKAAFSFDYTIDTGGSPYDVSFSWELRRGVTTGDCSWACLTTYESFASEVFKSGEPVGWIVPDGAISILSIAELSSGFYQVKQIGSAGSSVFSGETPWDSFKYDMNYNIALDVSSVPLPSAVWIFASGLIGLIGIARRKKSI